MKSNRLGCLTGSGIVAALITVFVIVGVAFASGSQMFSSGALNNTNQTGRAYGGVMSHAQIAECKACHTAPWESETMADRCATCHTGIAAEMFDVANLHGAITQQSLYLACRDCHPEHRGSTAVLTDLDGNVFPHEALGFSLNGHRLKVGTLSLSKGTREPFACADCHTENLSTFASSTCEDCHRQMDIVFAQAHSLSFGMDCLACHDGVDRFGDDFTHSSFAFKLEGKHADAACTDCHLDAHDLTALKTAPQDCLSCHSAEDPHQGRFGQDCSSCHSPQGWKPAKFDHNLSVFKLEGAHTNVACENCHQNGVYQGTPMDCYSCHSADDKHVGQFGTDCAACHNVTSWENVSVDHNLFAFRLEGAHANVACESCHQNGVFKGTPTECYSCHRGDDTHGGQFGTNCASCHTTSSWKDATFDHNLSAFKLTGAHLAVSCAQCHTNGVFRGTPSDCYSCHRSEDKHGGRFGTNCAACHNTSSWRGATFDHNLSGFPLTGRHTGLACERCHSGGQFSGVSSSCASCHGEPAYHAGMFSANCAECHSTNNWSAAYHGSHPDIADEGGRGVNHGGTTCRTCHTSTLRSATCTACHDGNESGEGGGEGGGD